MNKSLKYSDVKVHPVKNGWITVSRIVHKDLIIDNGYFTNAANIPRILWRLIPPNNPEIFPAVVIHDFLCDKKQFEKADNYLEEILIDSDVPKWKRKSIVIGVKFYTRWIRGGIF